MWECAIGATMCQKSALVCSHGSAARGFSVQPREPLLHEQHGPVLQAMYSLKDEDDPGSELVLDEAISDGYDDHPDSDALERWQVAPEHVRPWFSFEDDSRQAHWPPPEPSSLSVGIPCAFPLLSCDCHRPQPCFQCM
jgi:hypothetical protein